MQLPPLTVSTLTHFLDGLPSKYNGPLVFLPYGVLAVLAVASFIDARTGRIPDPLIIGGFLISLGFSAFFEGWGTAGERFMTAAGVLLLLKIVNDIFHHFWRSDAFGMGDAKWSALATLGFGLKAVFWSWIIGAWLGLFWMAGCKIVRFVTRSPGGSGYVHFAPFLFIGIVAAMIIFS